MKAVAVGLLLLTGACGGQAAGTSHDCLSAPGVRQQACEQAWIHMTQVGGCEPGASWIDLDCPAVPQSELNCLNAAATCAQVVVCYGQPTGAAAPADSGR